MDASINESLEPSSVQGTQSAHPARLSNCDAVMVALSRTRYVVVHRDDAARITPCERICKPIRQLQPGDRVMYNGRRETVYGVHAF